ncbi:hypothetical protein DWUX_2661 [Desulfovibrio diazotrophicus]|nr:hypothetical protein DWUX_2661 [Desulfovibrio diazotrophicus]
MAGGCLRSRQGTTTCNAPEPCEDAVSGRDGAGAQGACKSCSLSCRAGKKVSKKNRYRSRGLTNIL